MRSELWCLGPSSALPAENSLSNLPQQSFLVVLHVGLRLLQQELDLLLVEGGLKGGEFLHLCFVLFCICKRRQSHPTAVIYAEQQHADTN